MKQKRKFKYCRTQADALADPRVEAAGGINSSTEYWFHIELKPGWINEEVHEIIEPTTREALRELNSNVYPCECECCQENKQ